MKINKEEPVFRPVTITIETPEEANWLHSVVTAAYHKAPPGSVEEAFFYDLMEVKS